ncbi:hypothetical protein R9C00_07415 [Flammeovirgaceae bacterium SG7u.111]|nr:hypothetical protein [Flammeovirgaceae bacterium SG7u.132]WPO37274.1 hypothetical protein R9C00_07415 [Flammeovirgaceae bacterium SG7u.111]
MWDSETENMSAGDFETEMQEWLNAFKKCKPKFLYDRCNDFKYPISPDQQIWMAMLLNQAWIDLGLKKYAHMMPEELITELSVEQLFGEFFNLQLDNQFEIENFSDKDKALAWLYVEESALTSK